MSWVVVHAMMVVLASGGSRDVGGWKILLDGLIHIERDWWRLGTWLLLPCVLLRLLGWHWGPGYIAKVAVTLPSTKFLDCHCWKTSCSGSSSTSNPYTGCG